MKSLDSEVVFEFVLATGPGGQNVNKTATAVHLRFDVSHSPTLSSELKKRLIQLGGRRVTTDGILILEARRFRTREQNRKDALNRFHALIQKAGERPRKRRPTCPTRASAEKRLQVKKKHAQTKKMRRPAAKRED